VSEFRVLFLQLLELGGRLGGNGLTAMLDPASTCPLVDRLGDGIAVGDRPNRHPLHVMAPVNRGDRTHLPEPRRPVDRGLCADARRDRLCLIHPPKKFAFLPAKLGLPLDELGFPPGHLGRQLGEFGFLLVQLAFMLAHLPTQHGFPLDELGFPFGKRGLPLGKLGLPLPQRGVLLAKPGVFREVAGQLLLTEVDEKIDFLFVITT
jgi:hypothetical protein